jgi:uncharacterized surface protein with fasciclin (FAS1) repeats
MYRSFIYLIGVTILCSACNRNETRQVNELDFAVVRRSDSVEAIQRRKARMDEQFKAFAGRDSITGSRNIIDFVATADTFSLLHQSLVACQLDSLLRSAGPYTLFAPDNAAFKKLPGGTMANLMNPDSQKKLSSMMEYHIVPGEFKADELINGMKLTTLQGQELTVNVNDTIISISDPKGAQSNILMPNLKTGNGYLHQVDAVIIPG